MSPKTLDGALALLIENAYELANDEKLYGVDRKVPKSHEPDFNTNDNPFGKYIHYAGRGHLYKEWIDTVIQILDKYGLHSAKYLVNINKYDPRNESNLPAQLFLRALAELEKIRDDLIYRATYTMTTKLPDVTLQKNMLSQGGKTRKLSDKYNKLMHLLWSGRQIKDSSGNITRNAIPMTKSMVCTRMDINDTELADIQRAISGIQKKLGIQIGLYFPRRAGGVFLSVTQDV